MKSNKDYTDGLLDALKLANKMAYSHYFTPYADSKIIHMNDFEVKIMELIKAKQKSYDDLPI